MQGQKHLLRCRCVLPQYKTLTDPPSHKFVVFSKINDNNEVVIKYGQCNNCGIIHKITNICTSEIISGKESIKSLIGIEDIKTSIPSNFCNILEANFADLATWEAVQFIIENKRWGNLVVLSSEVDGNETNGKYIRVLGESICKIDSFTVSSGII